MTRGRAARGTVAAVAGIVLLAFSLRTAVASLSPVISLIQTDFAVPGVVAGLIGTAPPVCFAVFGLLTPALERRFGLQPLVVIALGLILVGLVVRSFAGDAVTLLVVTALLFAGVAAGNVLIPPVTKRYFPHRIGLMTTVYGTAMATATFLPPLVAVPIAEATDWRVSLGFWAVFAAAGLIPWIGLLVSERRVTTVAMGGAQASAFGRMPRLALPWALAAAFVVTSSTAYVSFAWMPTFLVDLAGVTPSEAGALLSLFAAVGLPCSLVIPLLVARHPRTVPWLFGIAVLGAVLGYGGLLLVPASAPWLWAVLLGLAPLLFPLVLVLIGQRSRTHAATVALSGFVQGVGYGVTAAFPVLIGVFHDATGGWTLSLVVMLGIVVLLGVPAGILASRPHTVEDEWERRHGAW